MRRTVTTLGVVAAVLLLALLGLWLARVPLASAWLAGTLERHGYPEARFEITYLGWSRAVIEDLAAATGEEPRADRVEARYAPWMLVSGDVRDAELTVSGLQLSLAPWGEAEADPAASAAPAPADPAELMAALGGLPGLRLEGARIALESPLGTWRIEADGELAQGEGGPEGDLAATARNERLRVDGRLDARLRPGRVDAALSATEDDGFAVRVDARARSPWDEPRLELEIESDLPAEADLPWALLPGPALAEGRMRLAATGSGRLATGSVPVGLAAWVRRLASGGWSGEWRAEGSGLALAHRFSDGELAANGRVTTAGDGATVSAEAGSRLAVATIHPSLQALLPGPLADAPQASGPMALTWPGGELLRVGAADAGPDAVRVAAAPAVTLTWPEAAGRVEAAAGVDASFAPEGSLQRLSVSGLRVRGSGLDLGASRIERLSLTGTIADALGQAEGEMALSLVAPRLMLGPAVLSDLSLDLPGRVEPGESGPRVVLADAGRLEVSGWRTGERIEGEGPVRAAVEAGQFAVGRSLAVDVTLAAEAFSARVQRTSVVERFEFDPGQVRLVSDADGWRIRVPAARAGWPTRDLAATGIAAVLRPGDGRRFASFDIERIEHAGDPAWLAPTTVSGRVTRNAGGFSVEGDGRVGRAGVPVRFAGELATEAGVGDLQVELPTVRFRPDGLQPAALAPALRRLERVDGRAGGSLRLQMRPDRLDGRARLRVEDLAFAAEAFQVRGLEGSVSLDGLRPPRAAPVQSLRAERIDAAVPVDDARVRFGVVQPPGSGTALRIVEGSGSVFGGVARVSEWTFDPDAQVHNVGVQLDGVELQEVLAYLDIEGLAGEGRLSGGLPVTLAGRTVAVREGRLRSGDGHIRFRSAHADEALANADRSVRMMLRALRDFEYERMDVALDRSLGREGEIRIRLEGRTPGVMDGRRFRFDIRLAGDFDPLVDALRTGRPLTDELVERHLDLHQQP
jgi:hypothetical protein